ncbi:protein ORF94 [Lake sturgeon herpesvirus]|nr:protein ORF94 [Lake sturgeon herpesvirus]
MPPKTYKQGPHNCPLCGFTTEHLAHHLRRGHKGLRPSKRQQILSELKHGPKQKKCLQCGIHVKRLDKHEFNCQKKKKVSGFFLLWERPLNATVLQMPMRFFVFFYYRKNVTVKAVLIIMKNYNHHNNHNPVGLKMLYLAMKAQKTKMTF